MGGRALCRQKTSEWLIIKTAVEAAYSETASHNVATQAYP